MTNSQTETDATCSEWVTRTVGRNEFQSRTEQVRCGKPVEAGHRFCPSCEARQAKALRKAKYQQELRAARAARMSK